MLGAAFASRPMPPERAEGAPTGWGAVKEGFAYLRGRRVLQSTFLIDIVAMVFGMPRALFPFLAASQFHAGAQVTGLLFSTPAVRALAGALTAGLVRRVGPLCPPGLVGVPLSGAGAPAFLLVARRLW